MLVVEDGSGKSDANAYASVSEADEYFFERNVTSWDELSTSDKEAAIIKATQWVDMGRRFKGIRSFRGQALQWPRMGVYTYDGRELSGIPRGVAEATCEMALRASEGDITSDLARGGRVASEKVGDVEIRYEDGAPAGTVYSVAEGLLSDYVRSGIRVVRR